MTILRWIRRMLCAAAGHPGHAREANSMLYDDCECLRCGVRWVDDNF